MDCTYGFVGCGNMGGALARCAAAAVGGANVLVSRRTAAKAEDLAREIGAQAAGVCEAAAKAQMLFLGVKPQQMPALFDEIAPVLAARTDRFVLVTMAAGLSMARIRELAGADYPVIRIMPNTPVAVGEGVILYCSTPDVTAAELQLFLTAFAQAGASVPLDESLMDAGCAMSGCGPAFVYAFIEAFMAAGEACGIAPAAAKQLAAQTVLGAARMVLESPQEPAQLREAVCSPGGATIEGVKVLQAEGFAGTVGRAVRASFNKSKALG